MIYDLTMYSGERDILEIRLETLKDCIDKFIIIESNFSHTLIKKPLFFEEERLFFDKFKDKIIYVVKDSHHQNSFYNDWEARLHLLDSIPNPKYDDIIHHSDNDEIGNPDKLSEVIKNLSKPVVFESNYSFFCADLYGRKDWSDIVMKYGWIREPFYKYRDNRGNSNNNFFDIIPNAGWHFSSVGTPENIVRKWIYFCHAYEINEKYKDIEYIKSQIKRKSGSWDENAPNDELKLIEHTYPNLPNYLIQNQEKFKHLFYDY
ncbi:MAG: hypothetical protein AABY22_33365 [Nanoarchaeota archaeon]